MIRVLTKSDMLILKHQENIISNNLSAKYFCKFTEAEQWLELCAW